MADFFKNQDLKHTATQIDIDLKDSFTNEQILKQFDLDLASNTRILSSDRWITRSGRNVKINAVLFVEPSELYLDGSVRLDGDNRLDGMLNEN